MFEAGSPGAWSLCPTMVLGGCLVPLKGNWASLPLTRHLLQLEAQVHSENPCSETQERGPGWKGPGLSSLGPMAQTGKQERGRPRQTVGRHRRGS